MAKKLVCLFLTILFVLYIDAPVARAMGRTALVLEYDGAIHYYDEENVTLILNGTVVTSFGADMPPIILGDRLYVPVRDVFEALGAVVDWNDNTQQIYIGFGGKLVSLRNDSFYINVDGEIREIPVAPKIINGRAMAPASFIAEAFGFKVEWVQATRTVKIDSGASLPQNPPETTLPVETPVVTPAPQGDGTNTTLDLNAGSGPKAVELAIDVTPEKFEEQNFPETKIGLIEYDPNNPQVFYIRATSPISKLDKFLLFDNRLVIDFYNAEMTLTETVFEIDSQYLSRIRTGQNQIVPEKITRIVFDLLEPVNYSVTLSPDRQTVAVSFLKNEIVNVDFYSDGVADTIVIHGSITPVVNVFPSTVPGKFIAEIPLGQIQFQERQVDGVFATLIRMEQFNPSTARIVIDMKDESGYTVTNEEGYTVIKLIKPTYQNVVYESELSRLVIPKAALAGVAPGQITHNDDYLNFQYTFTLPGDYSPYIGQGNYIIKDNYINYINIANKGGKTVITFFERSVMAYVVTEDAQNIYINAMLPRQKYPKIVVIDAGHGGAEPGSRGNGLIEKNLTLDIVQRIAAQLENSGIKVYLTRTGDTYPTREERAAFANMLGDLFISVHINSHETSSPSGTEVYYYEHVNDWFMGLSCKTVADVLQKNLLAELGSIDRGVKTARFVVLTQTSVPAALCEIGFLSNPAEASKLATESYRQRAANSIARSIIEIFGKYTPKR